MKRFKYLSMFVLLLSCMAVQAQSDTTVNFHVSGVCGQCKQRIQEALKLKGVQSASWDVATKMVTVKYTPSLIQLPQLHTAIAAAGHDTELMKARDDDYKALPECCHYREM